MFRKGFLCLFLVLITLAAMSTAAAVEFNETADDIASACTEGTELEVNDDVNEMVESDSDASEVLSADVSDDVLRDDEWKTFTELQELIDDWDEDYVLELDCNYYCDDDFADNNYAISINKTLTIDGGDYSLDACGKSAIFWIYADGVELENINFLNGIDNDKNGGGLYVMGETTIRNCFFEGCNATANGGAIFAAAKVTIKDTTFSNNEADEYGGAIYACYPSSGDVSLDITGSLFEENYARLGGAIYLSYKNEDDEYYNSVGKYFIKNTVFDFNGAGQNGGAILACQSGDILNCRFTNNYAYSCGGAIYESNGISNESAGIKQSFRLDVHGTSSFTGNSAERHGGAIYTYPFSSTLKPILNVYDSVVFEANNATLGGALYLRLSDSTIKEAKFKNNRAESGSAMYYGTAIDCVYEGNTEPATMYIVTKNSKTEVTLIPMPYSTLYDSGKQFQVLVIDTKTGAPMNGFEVKLQIYYPDSTKYFTKTITTGSNGIASLPFSYRTPGTYKIIVSAKNTLKFKATKQTTYAKISKSTFIIKAPKVKKRYKKTVKFKITVKDKATGKGFWSADLTVKVYTGKKFKKYYLDTNKNGKATLKLKKLKKGKHKVVIRASSTEYATVLNTKVYTHTPATKTSYIIIK